MDPYMVTILTSIALEWQGTIAKEASLIHTLSIFIS
jgi:hypothetical protein